MRWIYKTAFIHAALDDEEDGVYAVIPPAVAVRHGLVTPGKVWKLKKVLYGLRSGPKKWGEHRDKLLKELVVEQDGMKATLEQTGSCKNVLACTWSGGEHCGQVDGLCR